MKKYLLGFCLAWVGFSALGEEPQDLMAAIRGGKVSLDVNLRYENVDLSALAEQAQAVTIRTRLGYSSAAYKGWLGHLDFENITALEDDYNSTTNGILDRPVVADPETTEVNQAFLEYSGLKDQTFRLGRQRLIFDNARFVGNVGWRQNEQTFDAAFWQYKGAHKTSYSLVWVDRANRVFGDDHPQGNFDLNSLLAHFQIASLKLGNLSAFAYLIENESLPLTSHKDIGARLEGAWKLNDQLAFGHEVSYAKQTPFRDGVDALDNDYLMLAWGPNYKQWKARVGYEVLGGNGSAGFMTPLATLHAFNGWADMFLSTPVNGLQDIWVQAGWSDGKWNAQLIGHQFDADEGSADYGKELDSLATRKLKYCTLGAKYADFQGKSILVDVRKLWLYSQFTW